MTSKALHAARRRSYILWCWMDMHGDESNPAPPRPDPLRGCGQGSLRPSGIMTTTNICLRRGVSAIVHIHTSVLQALAGRGRTGCLEGDCRSIGARICTILDMNFREFQY
jgi:hypothetical protein